MTHGLGDPRNTFVALLPDLHTFAIPKRLLFASSDFHFSLQRQSLFSLICTFRHSVGLLSDYESWSAAMCYARCTDSIHPSSLFHVCGGFLQFRKRRCACISMFLLVGLVRYSYLGALSVDCLLSLATSVRPLLFSSTQQCRVWARADERMGRWLIYCIMSAHVRVDARMNTRADCLIADWPAFAHVYLACSDVLCD